MPKPLLFKSPSADRILAGDQRLTLRPANSGYRRGDVVKAMVRRRPAFAEVRVLKVETIPLEQLNRGHARRSGEPDVDALRELMEDLYPGQAEFDAVSFEVVAG